MIELETGTMTGEEYEEVTTGINQQEFKSNLKCFNDHNGFRRGELHTVLGPKGGGKSTLVKTMAVEILQNQKKLYTFLSEEKTQIYKMPVFRAFNSILKNPDKTNTFLSNWYLESQFNLDENNRTLDRFIERLKYIIKTYGIDAIIFDNFTTSFLGRLNIGEQGRAVELLKEVASEFNIVIILVLHTAKGTDIYKKLVDGEDVRGNATSVNIGSYNYIITALFRLNPPRVFLTNDKARYHRMANKKVYELYYNDDLEIFLKDRKSTYTELEEVTKSATAKQQQKKYSRNF